MLTSVSYTMRGRPFVVVGLWVTSLLPLTILLLDLSITCYLLTHVYHLTSRVLSPDHLTCSLARPYWYDQTIINLLYAWLLDKYHHLVMLSLYTQHDVFDLWLSSLRGPWLVILYHDQWPVFLLYKQWPDYIVLVYSWFLIMSISRFSRKVIIKLLNLKKYQLVLGRGKHADIDMCSCLQWH